MTGDIGVRTLQPIPRITPVHNQVGYVAEANILANALAPLYPPSVFEINAAFSIAGILRATITRGGNTQVVNFEAGAAFPAGSLLTYEMRAEDGDTINFRFSANATILILRVGELRVL